MSFQSLAFGTVNYSRDLSGCDWSIVDKAATMGKLNNAALAKLDDWMKDFIAIARIALKDHAQLLKVLRVFIRS